MGANSLKLSSQPADVKMYDVRAMLQLIDIVWGIIQRSEFLKSVHSRQPQQLALLSPSFASSTPAFV